MERHYFINEFVANPGPGDFFLGLLPQKLRYLWLLFEAVSVRYHGHGRLNELDDVYNLCQALENNFQSYCWRMELAAIDFVTYYFDWASMGIRQQRSALPYQGLFLRALLRLEYMFQVKADILADVDRAIARLERMNREPLGF